jgi:signal transduction histidine kinase
MELSVARKRARASNAMNDSSAMDGRCAMDGGSAMDGRSAMDDSLARFEELIEQTLTSTRELVQTLRPRILDDYGLGAGAEWMLERFAKQTALEVDWEVDLEDGEVVGESATATFRILQEALTNVARHAQASRVTVRLSADIDALSLRVTDDGIGLPEEGERRIGFGILGMEERARALGGKLELTRASGAGTTLLLRLPRSGP